MADNYMITTSFTLDVNTIERLKEMATSEDRSQSSFIRRLINQEYERTVINGSSEDISISQSKS